MATGGAYSLDLLPIRPADKVGGFLPVLPLDHACRTRSHYRNPGTSIALGTIPLGKKPRPEHQYKFFVECSGSGTRQRSTLCRVPYQAFGKVPDMGTSLADSLLSAVRHTLGKGNFFAECCLGHSAKTPSPSPIAVTDAFLCRVLSGTRQTTLSSARKKYSAKTVLPMHCMPSPFVECDIRQSVCRVFLRLYRVFQALGKAVGSGSEWSPLLL
jgi:hypothetical protein